jgi:perosamine synthetase
VAADAIPLIVPELRGNEWQYVRECLDTNWVSSVGSYVDRFERMTAEAVDAQYAVATVNGTAALHIALLLAGVEPGDEVLVSTLTFIAPANAVRYVGAWPVFIDAEPDHMQIDPAAVARFLKEDCSWDGHILRNRRTGRRVSAILPVHVLGHPADLDPILAIADKYSLPVIEDATEGLGARYRGRPLGGLGRMGCFSYNGNKIITTGGGGMLVTNDPDLAARARYLTTQAKDDPIEYVHNTVGYNYRLTNVLAALGCAQMEQLDTFVETKRGIAARYRRGLAGIAGLRIPEEAPWASSTHWMFTVLIDETEAGLDSRALLRALAAERIQARPLWQPMHRSPAHAASVSPACPIADQLHRQALSLPCSVGLSPDAQDRVIETIRTAIQKSAGGHAGN